MSRGAHRFLSAFTDDLVELELGPLSPDLRDRTRMWVLTRISGAGDLTRAGLAAAGLLLAVGVRLTTGRPYDRLTPDRRRAMVRWLAATRLPVAGEYVRAIRSLAVAYVYEARYASVP